MQRRKSTILTLSFLFLFGCASVPRSPVDGPHYSEKHLDFEKWGRKSACCSAQGKSLAIASGGEASTAAGMEIAGKGGNAVDVAVAVSFALAVERPHSAGLGGGGFLLLKLAKPQTTAFVDFRETAPHKAKKDMYLGPDGKVMTNYSLQGPFAVATPGFVAGLYEVHQKWGKLPWKDVLVPAIRLARDGFVVYPTLAKALRGYETKFKGNVYTRRLFFRNGRLLKEGDKLVQRDLAQTLERIAAGGRDEFYKGQTAKRITNVMRQYGGLISQKDLDHYEIQIRQPVAWQWKGYTFLGAPPPSAGGIVSAQVMKVLEEFDLGKESAATGSYVHLLAEVMKRAYADRSLHIGDPNFYQVPQSRLISDAYTDELRDKLNLSRSTPSAEVAPAVMPAEDRGTTHLSVIDDQGNAVAATLTINGPFGSGIVVPRTGIVLNNEMDDFSVKPGEKNLYGLTGGEANAIAPGKRPVSSMSPTVVLKDGNPVLAVGGSGGSRIISSVLQVTLNYLEVFPGDLKRSLFAPRMHHQWLPDKLELEDGFSTASVEWLKARGHEVAPPPYQARVQAVARNPNGTVTAVFDPRDMGGAEAK